MNETDNRATLTEIGNAYAWELVREDDRLYFLVHPDHDSLEDHREARTDEPGIAVLHTGLVEHHTL